MNEPADRGRISIVDRAPGALRALARARVATPGEEADLRSSMTRTIVGILVVAYAESRGLVVPRGATASWAGIAAALADLEARGASILDRRAAARMARSSDDAEMKDVLDRLLFERGAPTPWSELDVEDIVGAHEALVGFDVHIATGATMILSPSGRAVDLDALLGAAPGDRAAMVAEATDARTPMRVGAALERARSIGDLAAALARRGSEPSELVDRGSIYVAPSEDRRRRGAHYTPRAVTRPLVARALAPLLDRAGRDVDAILALRVCDPSMGTGAFLVEACRQIADRVTAVDPSIDARAARRLVASRVLHGVDVDHIAVDLARAALWLVVEDPELRLDFADAHLARGDALIGAGAHLGPSREAADALCRARGASPFHWPDAFPEVMNGPRRGFDAFIGNPPWVAYAGRAAQPLADDLFDFYLRFYPSFFGYRTLHGLFVYRAASLLAEGGRLGLVVPTSISDLAGYEPTRRAHDTLSVIDDDLPDFGDAFEGVFQPSMGLLSTRRASLAEARARHEAAIWRVARTDIESPAAALLARLSSLAPLPPTCFGERGLQTTRDDVQKLAEVASPSPPFVVPIREGTDVRAFASLPPRIHLDPTGLLAKLREPHEWREVRVLVRQTARFPIAAKADGLAFRNSILACFEVAPYRAEILLAYLNSTPIRWLHFMRHRDARQGMPQVKIAHLRSIPRVPGDAPSHLGALFEIGLTLGARNTGITREEQADLDLVVARALELSAADRAIIEAWSGSHPAP